MKNNLKSKKPQNQKDATHSQKFKTLILSIVFAVAIWLTVVYINDPSIRITLNNIDVRFSGELALKENGFVVTGKTDMPAITVTVSGKRSDLMDYMNAIYANIDVSAIHSSGTYDFATDIEMPNSRLTLEKCSVNSVALDVEQLRRKNIQITERQTGTNKDYIVDSTVTNEYVEITGAKSEVDKVAYGIATVDISSITEESTSEYSFAMYDENNSILEKNETIETQKAVVAIKNTPYKLASLNVVPELSGDAAKDHMIDLTKTVVVPPTVDVGISDTFSGDGIAVNIDKNTDQETEFYLKQTEGVYIPADKQTVKVKPVIVKKVTKTMNVKISALNTPSGMTADFVQEVAVTMVCAESTASENVKATIDLAGLEQGAHKAAVTITGNNIISVTPVEIDVTLK